VWTGALSGPSPASSRGGDDEARAELSSGFLWWQAILRDGLGVIRHRGGLRADADLDELALALLAALAGGNLLSRTMRTTAPLRAALARVASFAP
jgi:TetR/AcrR family transcriptional regulator, transcriptional repressor for nem operon